MWFQFIKLTCESNKDIFLTKLRGIWVPSMQFDSNALAQESQ